MAARQVVSADYAKVAAALAKDGGVEERPRAADQPFGATGLKVGGKMFAMPANGTMVLKLPATRTAALVAEGVGKFHDPGNGKPVKDWIALAPPAKGWLKLAREARDALRK